MEEKIDYLLVLGLVALVIDGFLISTDLWLIGLAAIMFKAPYLIQRMYKV